MKKHLIALFAALAIIISSVTAYAAVATETSLPPDEQETSAPVELSIDNLNVYPGMAESYQQGYTPTVANGVATIVLPIIASGPVRGSVLTATPNLGDPSSSPFSYKNYQKPVVLAPCAVNGGTSVVGAYLVRFDLQLVSQRVNGIYPVAITLEGQTLKGEKIQQTYTSYVTISDGKSPSSGQGGAPGVEKPTSQPKVIVSSYSVNPSPVVAGQEFTAKITLSNTNEKKAVQNMTVMVTSDCPNLTLLNESNTFYIASLGKGQTTELELKYKSGWETEPKQYQIALAIEYDNAEATTLSATGSVPVEITQPLNVELDAPKIADEVNAGDTLPLSLQVMNLGRSTAYNVRCEINAPGLLPSGTVFVGNLEAGTAKTGRVDVFIGTKDMNGSSDGKYGLTNGTITLIYEDAAGNRQTKPANISTTINEPVVSESANADKKEPEKAGQWWVSIGIGCALIIGFAVYEFLRRKNKVRIHETA